MSSLFIHLFNLSVSATWLIAAVIIIRLVLKKLAPRWTVCLLWAVVGLRLIIPFSIESDISLMPSVQTLNPDAIHVSEIVSEENDSFSETETVSEPISNDVSETLSDDNSYINNDYSDFSQIILPPITDISISEDVSFDVTDILLEKPPTEEPPKTDYIDSGIKPLDDRINSAISDTVKENPTKNPIKSFADIGCIIWIIGVAVLAVYAIINYLILKKRVSESIPDGRDIRRCEAVGSPFILGVFKPRIYLPFGLSSETESHIIAHERAHLKRLDHLIKPFGYILLAVYWFNPLVWIAYILLCRDIETACDEKVVKNLDADARKAYASALLECGIKRSVIAACPVAFGEIGVKQRVKNAITYKKPIFWIIIVAVVLAIVLAVFFLTSPPNDETSVNESSEESSVNTESSDTVSEEESEIEYVYDTTPRDINFTVKYYDGGYAYESLSLVINGDKDETIPDVIKDITSRDSFIELLESKERESNESIIADLKKLDENYFKHNILLVNDFVNPNYEVKRNVSGVRVDEKGVTITYRHAEPFVVSPAGNYRIVVTELKMSDVYGHEKFFAVAEDMTGVFANEDFECEFTHYNGFLSDEYIIRTSLDNVSTETIVSYNELEQLRETCSSSAFKLDSEKYDERFFSDNALLLVYVETASGGNIYLPDKTVSYREETDIFDVNKYLEVSVKRDLKGKDNRRTGHIFIAEVDAEKVFGAFNFKKTVTEAKIDTPIPSKMLLTVTRVEGNDRFFASDESGIVYQVVCNDTSKIKKDSVIEVIFDKMTKIYENANGEPIYELSAVTATPFKGAVPYFEKYHGVSARNNAMSTFDSYADITKEEAAKIKALLNGEGWTDGRAECEYDWIIKANGKTYFYSSYQKVFIDTENRRTLRLSTDENDILISFVSDAELYYTYTGTVTAVTKNGNEEYTAQISKADQQAILDTLNGGWWRYFEREFNANIIFTVGDRIIEYSSRNGDFYDPVTKKRFYADDQRTINDMLHFLSPDGVWRPTSEEMRVNDKLINSEKLKGRSFDYKKLIAMSSDEIAKKIFAPALEYYEIFDGIGTVQTSDRYLDFWDKDTMTFVRMYEVTDKRFQSYYALVANTRKYFNSSAVHMMFGDGQFMEYNGKLYYSAVARGSDIYYYKTEYSIKEKVLNYQTGHITYSVKSAYFKYDEDREAYEKDPTIVIPDERLEFKTVEARFDGWDGIWTFSFFELPY